jgi:CubicO group peptidase (beta-lactamase class C family)
MKHRVGVLLLVLLLWIGVQAFPNTGEPTRAVRHVDPAVLDRAVSHARQTWAVPGVAVVVVQGDEVHFSCQGVRAEGKADLVTPDTIFPLASCSKAFTTALLASLAGDGILDWDDPVRRHLPWFSLADPLADRDVRLRDLLCHRTGLGQHTLLWYRSPWPLTEQVRRAGRLPLDRPFRTTFQYQSTLFAASGLAAESAAGQPWAELIQQRLLEPLGMSATTCSLPLPHAGELAQPHDRGPDGRAHIIPRYPFEHPDPAGSIHSTARDLARWLLFQLGQGSLDGQAVVPASALEETWTPQIPLRLPPLETQLFPDSVQHTYGLGWVIHDLNGRKVLTHGGAIDGFRVQVTLLPREKVGWAILANLDGTWMNLALSHTFLDLFLDRPARDWHASFQEALQRSRQQEIEEWAARIGKPRPGTRPSREGAAYAGEYRHPAYGTVQIRFQGDYLVWQWNEFTGPLEHFHFDTFLLPVPVLGRPQVSFHLDEAGEVARMQVTGRLNVEFERVKTP